MYTLLFINCGLFAALVYIVFRGPFAVWGHLFIMLVAIYIVLGLMITKRVRIRSVVIGLILSSADSITTFFDPSLKLDVRGFYAYEANAFMLKFVDPATVVSFMVSNTLLETLLIMCAIEVVREGRVRYHDKHHRSESYSSADVAEIKTLLKAMESVHLLWIFKDALKNDALEYLELPEADEKNRYYALHIQSVQAGMWLIIWCMIPVNNLIVRLGLSAIYDTISFFLIVALALASIVWPTLSLRLLARRVNGDAIADADSEGR